MIRISLATLLMVFSAAVPTFADDLAPPVTLKMPISRLAVPQPRGSMLPVLYVSLAALQGYDGFSTTAALKQGGVEANPMMRGVAGRPMALWVVKGASTAATIYVAERLWRQNRRVHAVALMVAVNGLMAGVAVHNSSVLRQLK